MHAVSPATRLPDGPEIVSGCNSVLFDPSSSLVATRLDDAPGTVWIWDVQAAELRAALLFHGNISSLSWHPNLGEALLIRCEGDQYKGIVFAWDPLSEGPRSVDFAQHLPGAKTVGRPRALWLALDASSPPTLFLSDAQNYVLSSLVELDEDSLPWGEYGSPVVISRLSTIRREESPLELVPAADAGTEALGSGDDGDDSELEDTFIHKH